MVCKAAIIYVIRRANISKTNTNGVKYLLMLEQETQEKSEGATKPRLDNTASIANYPSVQGQGGRGAVTQSIIDGDL